MRADHAVDYPSGRVPDGISPIVAYRCWPYERDGLGARLGELAGGSPAEDRSAWEGASSSRWVRASCRPDGKVQTIHEAPLETCSCGFYAVKELFSLTDFVPGILDLSGRAVLGVNELFSRRDIVPRIQDHTAGVVLGKVQLAGKIVEHELGYRAERARIVELIPIRGSERDVRKLGSQLRLKVGDPVDLYRTPSGDGPSSPQLGLRSWVRAALEDVPTTAKMRLVA
jgi:hypothetical protein